MEELEEQMEMLSSQDFSQDEPLDTDLEERYAALRERMPGLPPSLKPFQVFPGLSGTIVMLPCLRQTYSVLPPIPPSQTTYLWVSRPGEERPCSSSSSPYCHLKVVYTCQLATCHLSSHHLSPVFRDIHNNRGAAERHPAADAGGLQQARHHLLGPITGQALTQGGFRLPV